MKEVSTDQFSPLENTNREHAYQNRVAPLNEPQAPESMKRILRFRFKKAEITPDGSYRNLYLESRVVIENIE